MLFLQNISLKDHLTMRLAVNAKKLVKVFTEDDLLQLWKVYRSTLKEAIVIGGGSNLVITKDLDQLVILMEIPGIDKDFIQDKVSLKVGAGVVWEDFIQYCLTNDFGGVENLISIPGKVGAAPMQNIGAYGVEVKDVIHRVKVFNLEEGIFEWISNEACQFGYRESIFKHIAKNKYIIVQVEFHLSISNHQLHIGYGDVKKMLDEQQIQSPSIKDIAAVIAYIRQSKLPNPRELPNCGSFFKNPIVDNSQFHALKIAYPHIPHYIVSEDSIKIPAGWLIETAGWKGRRIKSVGVHEKQALVIVNYEHATGSEIWEFSSMIQKDILDKFGIELEREVNFI